MDGIFEFNSITASNIKTISDKQAPLFEGRMLEIHELAAIAAEFAHQMISEGYGIYEALSVISEGFADFPEIQWESSLRELIKPVNFRLRLNEVTDKAMFSAFFVELFNGMGEKLSENSFLATKSVPETFTYVKNSLSDEAYDVFSQEFINPTVRYSSGFAEAARAVSRDEAGYCLLPLEEKGGTRLSAVASVLFKEDLKINSVIPVFGFEGTADMKYALVSKYFTPSEHNKDDDRYLEIRIRIDSSIPLSELFVASEALGYRLYRVNTISFDTDEGPVPHYSIVFKVESGEFTSLLVFLTMFSGAYTTIGIYKNLE